MLTIKEVQTSIDRFLVPSRANVQHICKSHYERSIALRASAFNFLSVYRMLRNALDRGPRHENVSKIGLKLLKSKVVEAILTENEQKKN